MFMFLIACVGPVAEVTTEEACPAVNAQVNKEFDALKDRYLELAEENEWLRNLANAYVVGSGVRGDYVEVCMGDGEYGATVKIVKTEPGWSNVIDATHCTTFDIVYDATGAPHVDFNGY